MWPQIKHIHSRSKDGTLFAHSSHSESSCCSGIWTHLQTGQVESPHCSKQSAWNAWLHKMVKTPATDSSILSRQTAHMGSSVWPGGGVPSNAHSTFDTHTILQMASGSKLLNGAPLKVPSNSLADSWLLKLWNMLIQIINQYFKLSTDIWQKN